MAEAGKWQWQESGTAWRGIGVYHVTLTVPSREALLGTLVIPDGDPLKARIDRTILGNAVVDELYTMCRHYPAVRILQFCLMPDHLHVVIHVTQTMKTSIRSVIRGYWQGVKKLGRAYTLSVAAELNSAKTNEVAQAAPAAAVAQAAPAAAVAQAAPAAAVAQAAPATAVAQAAPAAAVGSHASTTAAQAAASEEGFAFPVFTERPFIRPLSRRGQLKTMIHYVQMNPQRLATKRLRPGYFRVQKDIEIGDRRYDGVGNVALLTELIYDVVHVRSIWVKAAEHGDNQALRDYMNSRVLMARKGVILVSPFISTQEKLVMQVLLKEQKPFVLLTDNGFRDYYKPADILFDACAAGRLLILSPWPYDGKKRHISRADCVALNAMAGDICKQLMSGKDACTSGDIGQGRA